MQLGIITAVVFMEQRYNAKREHISTKENNDKKVYQNKGNFHAGTQLKELHNMQHKTFSQKKLFLGASCCFQKNLFHLMLLDSDLSVIGLLNSSLWLVREVTNINGRIFNRHNIVTKNAVC